jgi:hypothetical protein
MRVASRAAGRRARRRHRVERPVIVLLCARFGFHLLSSSGTCPFRPEVALPSPLRRRRCGSTGVDPSSAARPRSRDPRTGLAPPRLGEIAAPRLVTLATRVLALRRSPCVSERASSEVPGCGHASCPSARGSAQPRPGLSPVAGDPSPAIGLACDASVRTLVGGPPAGRLRRRGLGGSPSTCTKAQNGAEPSRQAAGRNRRVLIEGAPTPVGGVGSGHSTIPVDLVVGAGKLDRPLQDVEALVDSYHTE